MHFFLNAIYSYDCQTESTFLFADHRDFKIVRPAAREKRQRVVRTSPISRQSFHLPLRAEKVVGTFTERRRPKQRRKRSTGLPLQKSGRRVHQLHGQGNRPTRLSTIFRHQTQNGRRPGSAKHSTMDRTRSWVRISLDPLNNNIC